MNWSVLWWLLVMISTNTWCTELSANSLQDCISQYEHFVMQVCSIIDVYVLSVVWSSQGLQYLFAFSVSLIWWMEVSAAFIFKPFESWCTCFVAVKLVVKSINVWVLGVFLSITLKHLWDQSLLTVHDINQCPWWSLVGSSEESMLSIYWKLEITPLPALSSFLYVEVIIPVSIKHRLQTALNAWFPTVFSTFSRSRRRLVMDFFI